MRVFVTGDKHGSFNELIDFCNSRELTSEDYVIILGDVGFNYYLNIKDSINKEKVHNNTKCTFICIHGNHEERPCNISSYKLKYNEILHCNCWVEDDYPRILFPEDGYMKLFDKTYLILGGAYSIDKQIRIIYGYNWFSSEQMPDETMNKILDLIKDINHFNFVLSHTCPLKYEPRHKFLNGLDQSTVDKRMEIFFDKVDDLITYDYWYFGHYHGDEQISDKVYLMFNSYRLIDSDIPAFTFEE